MIARKIATFFQPVTLKTVKKNITCAISFENSDFNQ